MQKNRGFAAMLGLLIVLVIAMMIYFLDIRAIFGPSSQYTSRPTQEEDHPWQMENLLVGENQIVPPPHRGQLDIRSVIQMQGNVQRNNAPRGSVQITIGKNCRVTGLWSARYQDGLKTYSLQSEIKGNIVPDKVYSDANGDDPTRLYFFGKGNYTQTIQSSDKTVQAEKGTAYMMGWLRPDHTASGTITITTDQSWSAMYPFTAKVQSNQ